MKLDAIETGLPRPNSGLREIPDRPGHLLIRDRAWDVRRLDRSLRHGDGPDTVDRRPCLGPAVAQLDEDGRAVVVDPASHLLETGDKGVVVESVLKGRQAIPSHHARRLEDDGSQ